METIPKEVISLVFSYFDLKEIWRLRSINRYFDENCKSIFINRFQNTKRSPFEILVELIWMNGWEPEVKEWRIPFCLKDFDSENKVFDFKPCLSSIQIPNLTQKSALKASLNFTLEPLEEQLELTRSPLTSTKTFPNLDAFSAWTNQNKFILAKWNLEDGVDEVNNEILSYEMKLKFDLERKDDHTELMLREFKISLSNVFRWLNPSKTKQIDKIALSVYHPEKISLIRETAKNHKLKWIQRYFSYEIVLKWLNSPLMDSETLLDIINNIKGLESLMSDPYVFFGGMSRKDVEFMYGMKRI